MAYKRRMNTVGKKKSSFTLNITSMTDMFTIMLVFLLQTYSNAEVQITPEKDLKLPSSDSMKNPTPGVQIKLSRTNLRIDDKIIFEMADGRLPASVLDSKDADFIKPLFQHLESLNKEKDDIKGEKERQTIVGKLLLQADGTLPYEVIRKVFYTASMAGFPQVKMVTVVGGD